VIRAHPAADRLTRACTTARGIAKLPLSVISQPAADNPKPTRYKTA
jgi:hypothetical protein